MIKRLRKKLHQLFTICFDFIQDVALWILEHDYFVFLGFMPIFYLIYRRVFYIRTPKNLLFDPEDVTLLQIGIYFWLVAIFSYLLYRYCQEKWFPKEPKELPLLVKFWLSIWMDYLDRRAKGFYTMCMYFLPTSDILFYISNLTYHSSQFCRFFVIFTNPFPRSIVSLFFAVDIFYFHKFHYFYLSLYLLVLPLMYKALTYVLLQFYYKTVVAFDKIIIVDEDVNVNGKTYTKISFINPDMYNRILLTDYLEHVWNPVKHLPIALTAMDSFKTEIMSKINPFVYLINIIGWGYLFFYALVIILI